MRNLWAVDIETGGLEFGRPIYEVAYGPVFGDELMVLWNTVPDAANLPAMEEALAINRVNDPRRSHHPNEECLKPAEMASRIEDDLRGKVLIAANPQFDSGHMADFLWFWLWRKPSWSYRLIDIKSLVVGWASARGLLQEMPEKGWGQKEATEMAGLPDIAPELLHTAAGDVEQVRQLARMVLGGD